MSRRFLQLLIVLTLSVLAQGFLASSGGPSAQESVRSWPPDTTPYAREAVPEELPTEGEIFSPPPVFIRDVVVSNTDPNLTNTDTFNDGETSIAVNPLNPDEIVITAFSGSWAALGPIIINAPLWHSTNGGVTWTKRFSIPSPTGLPDISIPGIGVIGCPCDQTIDYGRGNQLSGTFLVGTFPNFDVFSATTPDPTANFIWFEAPPGITQRTNNNVPSSFGDADQPWLLVNRDPTTASQDNVYVAYDDFSGAPDMRVAVAKGTNPPNFVIDALTGFSTSFVNPGHRLAVDSGTGTVYSLFQRRIAAGEGGSQNINYMLNRSTDGGAAWILNGSATGIVVANADSTQPTPKFGTVNALLGGVLHAAVNPATGDIFYVYGNRDSDTGNNRLAIRRITNAGGAW